MCHTEICSWKAKKPRAKKAKAEATPEETSGEAQATAGEAKALSEEVAADPTASDLPPDEAAQPGPPDADA